METIEQKQTRKQLQKQVRRAKRKAKALKDCKVYFISQAEVEEVSKRAKLNLSADERWFLENFGEFYV